MGEGGSEGWKKDQKTVQKKNGLLYSKTCSTKNNNQYLVFPELLSDNFLGMTYILLWSRQK